MAKTRTCPVEGIVDVDFDNEPFQSNFKKIYEQLHTSGCPFAHSSAGDHYAIASHQDIKSVLKDHRLWKNKYGAGLTYEPAERDVLISVDPPEHTVQVRMIAGSFSREYFESLRPEFEAYVHGVIDKNFARGQMDMHKELSVGLPMFAVFKILGLSLADENNNDATPWLRDTVLHSFSLLLTPDSQIKELRESGFEMPLEREGWLKTEKLFQDHIQNCRDGLERGTLQGDSNLITRLLTKPSSDGELLPEEKILGLMLFLLVAGSATTTNLLSNIFYRLLTEPGVYDQLRANPELREQVIEETLRIDAPVHGLFRTNEEELKFGPLHMEKHTKLLLLFGAAGLDPNVFEDPQQFSLERDLTIVKQHLAFGYGTHFCRGAPLARLEADVVLDIVMQRLPNLKLLEAPEREKIIPVMVGFKALQVGWDNG